MEDLLQKLNRNAIFFIIGEDVNRFNVEKILKQHKHSHILYYGHGDPSGYSIPGINNEPIINNENKHLLSGRKIFTLSCFSSSLLKGIKLDKHTCFFIGYEKKVFIPTVKNSVIQECYKQPNNIGAVQILTTDNNAEQIYDNMITKYEEMIDVLSFGKNEDLLLAAFLQSNRDKLRYRQDQSQV